MKRLISFVLTLTLVVTMCFGGFGAADVHAAGIEGTALSVYDGDKLVKEYTLDDLKAIAKAEGDIKYKFSGYNRNPSFYTFGDENAKPDVKEVVGPTVAGILADAGVTYNDDQLITFYDNLPNDSGYKLEMIAGDLFNNRYYFPAAKGILKGDCAPEIAYANAELVVPIIDLHRRSDDPATEDNEDEHESVLRFGQGAPNERNYTFFNKYVADGGKIIVGDAVSEHWEAVTTPIYTSGEVLPDTAIEFDTKYTDNIYAAATVYYTVDGTEPEKGDYIYNYDKNGNTYPPVLEDEGTYTIKVKVIGYGKLDSETTTFTYTVIDDRDIEVATPENFNAALIASDSVKLTWTPVEGAYGYEILRADPETGKMHMCIDVTSGDASETDDSALISGSEYTYQVRAYIKLNSGQKVYGSASAKQTIEIPDLTAPALTSAVSAGYSSIQIKWEEKNGFDGYEIFREDISSDGYKLIKKIEDNSVVSFKDTGLQTGNEYSYMIRSYLELANGTVIYSDNSDVKTANPILAKPALNSAVKTGYGGVQIKWSKVFGAAGYEIWRYDAVSKKYTRVKTVTDGSTVSWKNTGLKTGRKYTYKVRAYRVVNNKNVYSGYSGTKAATPVLNKPIISKLTAGPKSVTVKWNKVPGANGYKIYRSATGKAGSFKVVKTINQGGTVSWKNTKLKKGKRYYYKVKAYRIVDKKYVYSSISSAKYIKAK